MSVNKTYKSKSSQRLTEQKAEMEALFTSIGDGAISTDEFGKITRVNPKAQQILGYKESEVIGEWFPKIIVALSPENKILNLIDRPITKAFLTGRTISEKLFYRRKNGQPIPVSITVSPIVLQGKPLGAIEVFRDITLEEEIDRMKSEFISLASHQLRTPLSAIKTYSHMLVDGYMGPVTEPQKKSLKTIIGATNRMNDLISTLLNITRMESGSIKITLKNVNLEKLVDEVLQEVSWLAIDRTIKLESKNSGQASKNLRTDPLILKEIITNLVTNGIKYTPEGGKVRITLQRRANRLIITVHDSGLGIPKYSQSQIFSKFFRAQNVVKQETTGTGLGLYLVKGLVDALGGNIWFNSQEGKGTKFFVSLPVAPNN